MFDDRIPLRRIASVWLFVVVRSRILRKQTSKEQQHRPKCKCHRRGPIAKQDEWHKHKARLPIHDTYGTHRRLSVVRCKNITNWEKLKTCDHNTIVGARKTIYDMICRRCHGDVPMAQKRMPQLIIQKNQTLFRHLDEHPDGTSLRRPWLQGRSTR